MRARGLMLVLMLGLVLVSVLVSVLVPGPVLVYVAGLVASHGLVLALEVA